MSEREYVSGLGFVAGVLSEGIERLPMYHVEPENVTVTEIQPPQLTPTVVSTSQHVCSKYNPQQGVKRTCSHSQKSTHMKYAEKK